MTLKMKIVVSMAGFPTLFPRIVTPAQSQQNKARQRFLTLFLRYFTDFEHVFV